MGFRVEEATKSPRVRGLVLRLLRTRLPRRQREPLTVDMAAYLETMACDSKDETATLLAGTALFCLYARARVGDVRRCSVEPTLDLTSAPTSGAPIGAASGGEPTMGPDGYVETCMTQHKTAKVVVL